jgi:hypothetical protein
VQTASLLCANTVDSGFHEDFVVPDALLASADITSLAASDEVFGEIVPLLEIQVIYDQCTLRSAGISRHPGNQSLAPIARMSAGTDGIEEDFPMFPDSTPDVGHRMSMLVVQPAIIHEFSPM